MFCVYSDINVHNYMKYDCYKAPIGFGKIGYLSILDCYLLIVRGFWPVYYVLMLRVYEFF